MKGKQYAMVGFVVVLAAAAIGFLKMPHNAAEAQSTPAPVVGIQSAERNGGSCTVKLSNVQYSNNIDWTQDFVPPDDVYSTYPDAASYTNSTIPPGNTDCVRIYLQGTGPFTQDFRIGVRMMRKYVDGVVPAGWGPWGWTPWVSDIASGAAAGNLWSPWVGDLVDAGADPGYSYYQIAVQTSTLALSQTVSISSVGIQGGDWNVGGSNPPYYCIQPPQEQDADVYSTGGWSWGGPPDGRARTMSMTASGSIWMRARGVQSEPQTIFQPPRISPRWWQLERMGIRFRSLCKIPGQVRG